MEPGILYSKSCESLRGINFLRVLARQAVDMMGSEAKANPQKLAIGCRTRVTEVVMTDVRAWGTSSLPYTSESQRYLCNSRSDLNTKGTDVTN